MARLIWLSFARQIQFYAILMVSLALAVSGLLIVNVYRQSLKNFVSTQGESLLGGHITLSARRAITPQETDFFRSQLPRETQFAEMTEFFAMVSSGSATRLALLRFVDNTYPLMGDLLMAPNSQPVIGAVLEAHPEVVVAADLLNLMELQVGQELTVGQSTFKIRGVLEKDSSQTFRLGNMAPRVYVHKKYLPDTGLMRFGSTFTQVHYARLPRGANTVEKARFEARLQDPALQITTPKDLEQGSLRMLAVLLDYLGLIGLISLGLGWVGVYYISRRWLAREKINVGLWKCLGLNAQQVRMILFSLYSLTLLISAFAGGFVAWAGSQVALPWFRDSLPQGFTLVWSWTSAALLLAVGPLVGWMLMVLPIHEVSRSRPLDLLHGLSPRAPGARSLRGLLGFTALVMLVGITYLQARSLRITLVFLASVGVTLICVSGLTWLGLRWLSRIRTRSARPIFHLASAIWVRRPASTMLLVGVTCLSVFLAQLIPHVDRSLTVELEQPPEGTRPAIFLFDVQDEQISPLLTWLKNQGVPVMQHSPIIRARLIEVNDQPYERLNVGEWSTREEEAEARFRNRGINLSYREHLSPSETIVKGKPWEQLTLSPPEISVETGYADRMGLKLGDVLDFDIQGVSIQARIASLRSVKWTSFQPNFFIQFREGVLEDAPKTWLVSSGTHPIWTTSQLQLAIAKEFPNVSSLHVQETSEQVSRLIGKLSSGLKSASALTLALGLIVFFTILMFQLSASTSDWEQLRVIGLSQAQIRRMQIVTYAGLNLLGAVVGSVLAMGGAWAITRLAFQAPPRLDIPASLTLLFVTLVISLLCVLVLGRRFGANKPLSSFGNATVSE